MQASKVWRRMNSQMVFKSLKDSDNTLYSILLKEQQRQKESICLIPSENFTSRSVMDALGSVFQNKYSEGYPRKRYYGGNEYIDQVEELCQARALKAFDLSPSEWGVNVQALSGAPANLYVYGALLKPHERLMGLDLPHGGHLSHGYQTPTKKISMVSAYFETLPYRVNENGVVDYDKLLENALLYRPKLIVAGASAYSRNWDYKRMREICDQVGAYLMADMAHISGLVSAGVVPTPFEYADVVTTTTHKSLRGPRGAMIFFRKGTRKLPGGKTEEYNLENPINFSVFPGHQGGPHNHTIAALAVALAQTQEKEYKDYQLQVLKNAKAMENTFKKLGYDIVSGGTDTHLLLLDLRGKKLDGARLERVLELVNIAANKNTIPSDTSALVPHGLRIGSPAMTTRGFKEQDFEKVCVLIDDAVKLGLGFAKEVPSKKFADFKKAVKEDSQGISDLKVRVVDFAKEFPLAV